MPPFPLPLERDSHLKITLLSTSVNCSCLNIPPNTPEPSLAFRCRARLPNPPLTPQRHLPVQDPYLSRYLIWKTRGDGVVPDCLSAFVNCFFLHYAFCLNAPNLQTNLGVSTDLRGVTKNSQLQTCWVMTIDDVGKTSLLAGALKGT